MTTEALETAREALERIASWPEGDTVGGHFNEPESAQIARDALAALAALAEQQAEAPVSGNTEGCARLESEAQIVGDKVVISLRVSTLAHAARHSDYFDRCAEQGTPLEITSEAAFAKSVTYALNSEEEDGSTPITRMLDKAFEHVSERGEEGVGEAGEADRAKRGEAVNVTDEMVDAYLKANDAYWNRTDELPRPPGKWCAGTSKEATAESLRAALAAAPKEPT
jgi:hypothetical protein